MAYASELYSLVGFHFNIQNIFEINYAAQMLINLGGLSFH